MTSFLKKLQSSTPGAALVTAIRAEVFRVSLPQVLALSDHCDGDIKDESEGDPAAAAVDDGHQHGRR